MSNKFRNVECTIREEVCDGVLYRIGRVKEYPHISVVTEHSHLDTLRLIVDELGEILSEYGT